MINPEKNPHSKESDLTFRTLKVANNRYDSQSRANYLIHFLREYANDRVNSRLIDERRCIPPHVIQDLAREGFFGLQILEKYGGQNLNFRSAFRVLEQSAAIDPNIMLLLNVHHAIGTPPIKYYGTEEQKNEILPELASGRALATLAASEPGAGSNVKALKTRAQKLLNGDFLINGEKCWISLGSWAGYITLFAQQTNEQGVALGMTGFVVKQETKGFVPGAESLTLGMKGIPQNQIQIQNMQLSSKNLLGEEGQGALVAQSSFMTGRLLVAVNGLGGMKRCLQLAGRFAQRRIVATGSLFENGHTQVVLNDCVAATRALESFIYDVADRLDNGQNIPTEIYMVAKILGAELSWSVIDRCLQLLGARGFMDTNVVGQYFRDFRLARIFEGPTESLQLYLGLGILKDKSAFYQMLISFFNGGSIAQTLETCVDRLEFEAQKNKANREVSAMQIGELASWAIFVASLFNSAQKQNSEQSLFVESWALQHFERRLKQIENKHHTSNEIAEAQYLADQIQNFSEDIGFTQQSLAGEAREIDSLLDPTFVS